MVNRKNKVFQKDWLRFHPDSKPSPTDFYYQGLCNKVYHCISDIQDSKKLSAYEFFEEDIVEMAAFLTCYFEDVISKAGIWQAFTSWHLELYGRYLPFFKPVEYFNDEINREDIRFLIWYYYSAQWPDNYYEPGEVDFEILAKAVYEIFDEEYEFAPINKKLKEFLTIPENENDYYNIRKKIDWLFMQSYLFFFHELTYIDEIEELADNDDLDLNQLNAYASEVRDATVNNKRSHLLALRGKDWLAGVLGKEHPLYNDVLNISERKSSHFLYKGEDENNLMLEHLASNKILHVTKKSMEVRDDFEIDQTIITLSLVNWKNEWWFSGISAAFDYDADLVLKEKNDIESRALFQNNTKEVEESLQKHYKSFLKFNNNSPIAFFEKGEEVNEFYTQFIHFWNKSLKLSKKERKMAEERSRTNGLLGNEKHDDKVPQEFKESSALIFFNKNSGTEVLFGYNSIIPDKSNPLFDPDEEAMLDLFMSEHCSADFVKYLLETYPEMRKGAEVEEYCPFMLSDTDFLLRFWKKNNYYAYPQITLI